MQGIHTTPYRKYIERTGLAIFICVIAAVLTGFIYAGFNWSLYTRVWKTAVLWYFNVALLTPIVFWVSYRVSFERYPKPVFFLIHGISAFVFAVIWTALAFFDLKIHPDPEIIRYLYNMYPQYFNIGLFIYAAIAGWLYMWQFHRQSKEQIVRESELKRLAREAELRALKAQINPHFLFNALNSVNALVIKDPEGARELNTRLGNVFRYVLDSSEREFVTLKQELAFVNDYLGIEKLRLAEKLSITIDVDDILMDAWIPPMTLEPIVENAIIHGLSKLTEGGAIAIGVKLVDGNLQCRVRDTGGGILLNEDKSMLDRGIGLRNTLERLKLLYEDRFSFHIEANKPSGITVTLSIPFEEDKR